MQLSRDSIIAAALEILDSFGLADMTMRRVASQLGVAPGALYWHVANKQELIAAIAERIITPTLPPDPGLDTPAGLCTRLREALLSRRDGAELVGAALSQPDSATRADVEKQLALTLTPYRLDADDERVGAATLLHLVLGSTTLEQARRQLAEATAAGDGQPPETTSTTETADADFRRGIELCLAGLAGVGEAR
ncbi:TetR family transcriptional regulator [Corynebacterium halotolerans]|uniref:TetR-family transcription regulator n=1 Tax=Corynebacterium halotolerans YIM 70093 = DSM 44683 TaxID=1121362 RepID=M1NNB1_9CORY|nr:TetR family transcriptional regulator [Corynebacterium halotolerans]AGF72848.1 TetR-family transcription regulator [Corynebacterium halotolerans YIM 70093 = DSM 44683]